MAQSSRRSYYSIGDYVVTRQIGAGSFSTVWHACHRVHGTEYAIKEIAIAGLNPKLQESLKSEIFILKSIDHPNIIRLHDMIEEPGKLYIVLEYCKGGDLSMYNQVRRGKIPEATVKHFMQQLAEGLKVLRQNNLVHRDLKPQNLLLSANNDKSVLKIADFGFARPLQPWVLAETLCGSPLYMAPEIMQLQKYDAKADLWSVGAILFQLVTGKPPFTGSNQIQLLQNIIKSTELKFPPEAKDLSHHCVDLCRKLLRRNPVERLTFEEFFNHPYLSNKQSEESFKYRQSQGVLDGFTPSQRNTEKGSQEDSKTLSFDDDSGGPNRSPSFPRRPVFGFSLNSKPDRKDISNLANQTDSSNSNSTRNKTDFIVRSHGSRQLSEGNLKESLKTIDPGSLDNHPKVMDSMEAIFQDYVIVSGPPLDLSSSACASKLSNFQPTDSPPLDSENMRANAPTPAVGSSVESHISDPRSSQGSLAITYCLDQPPKDCMARIKSLQHYAASISELVNQKIDGGETLEAFSVQLVILAIWKQALHICHTHAASIEGSSSQESTRSQDVSKVQHNPDASECLDVDDMQGPIGISSQIEMAFLYEVEYAEELAKVMETGNVEMPDAMELIYRSALAWGRSGAVDEYMGNTENAVVFYSKAVRLLLFILVEASCLILNPPFSLTNLDRYRIQSYVDALNNRQSFSESQRMALFKAEDQPI